MEKKTLFLGIDVGTSGLKALLVDENGRVRDQASRAYATDTPRPLWAEQSPEDWWKATVETLRELSGRHELKKNLAGLALTGQMHGSVCLDRSGRVMRPAILWCDQRTGAEAAEIEKTAGRENLVRITGNPSFTGFTAPKIAWLKKHEPDVFRRLALVLLPKDYIRYRLTGVPASEVTDNSGTSLFDINRREWAHELIDAFGFRREWFPGVLESGDPAGKVSGEASAQTGLPAGLAVAAGAGDQAASGIGNGVVAPGIVSTTLGSSGVIFAFSDTPRTDPAGRLHTMCHAVPGAWHLMGATLSAGAALQWFSDHFPPPGTGQSGRDRDPCREVEKSAAEAPAGSEGLVFLPYLSGERTPHANPLARGVFFGFTARHSHAHFSRAVLEGVACALRDSLEIMREMSLPVSENRLAGGGARSENWCRILASVFHQPLTLMKSRDSTALGAAVLSAAATGFYPGVPEACAEMVRAGEKVAPDPRWEEIYEEIYRVFRRLYQDTKEHFDDLARIGV